jgi:hypothetical protein
VAVTVPFEATAPVALAPSPKIQVYVSASPSASVAVAVKVTWSPGLPLATFDPSPAITGASFASPDVTWIGCDSVVRVPSPTLSETLNWPSAV